MSLSRCLVFALGSEGEEAVRLATLRQCDSLAEGAPLLRAGAGSREGLERSREGLERLEDLLARHVGGV